MFEELNDHRKAMADNIHKVFKGDIEKASKWNVGDTNVFKGRLCQVVRFNDKGRPVWRIIDKKKEAEKPKTENKTSKTKKELVSDYYKYIKDMRMDNGNSFRENVIYSVFRYDSQNTFDPEQPFNSGAEEIETFDSFSEAKKFLKENKDSRYKRYGIACSVHIQEWNEKENYWGDGEFDFAYSSTADKARMKLIKRHIEQPKIEKQIKKEDFEPIVPEQDTVSSVYTADEKFGRYLEQELKDDYDILKDSYDNSLKKKMAEKYNIDTKKTAEIQKQILLGIQEKRNQKTREQLTVEDLDWWSRLYPNTDTYNGLKAALRDESEAFIDLLMEKYREGKEKAESKAHYGYSSWDRLRISRYKNIVRYLNEKKNAADEGLQNLIKNLTIQTQDLKDRYLEQIRAYSEVRWEANREWVAKTRKKIEDLKAGKDYNTLSKEVLDEIDRLRMYLNRHAITVSKKDYVEDRVKMAKKNFENDIQTIADKVRQRGIDESKIKTRPFSKDDTGIDMLIGDENRGLWARGILAAEYSEKVSPHYRFIVTEKNDGSYRVK